MNIIPNTTSWYTKMICGSIVAFSIVALLPNLRWYKEKYLEDTIISVNDSALDQLYEILWYDTIEQTVYPYEETDIDRWHINTVNDNFRRLYQKLSFEQQTEQWTIRLRYPVQFSQYNDSLKKEHLRLSYDIVLSQYHIKHFAQKFDMLDTQAKSLIIILMHLSATEYVEKLQFHNSYTQFLTKSGYNRVDLRANIWWVLELCEQKNPHWFVFPVQKDDIVLLIQNIQQHYQVMYANDILHCIQKDIGFDMKVHEKIL